MAAALSALPFAATAALGFRRTSRQVSQAIMTGPPLSSCCYVNAGFRSMNAVKLHKMHRGPVFASETNPSSTERNETKPSSVRTDSPPLATILFGVAVFLLFAWLVGSVVLWIVGLIVNVPKS